MKQGGTETIPAKMNKIIITWFMEEEKEILRANDKKNLKKIMVFCFTVGLTKCSKESLIP